MVESGEAMASDCSVEHPGYQKNIHALSVKPVGVTPASPSLRRTMTSVSKAGIGYLDGLLKLALLAAADVHHALIRYRRDHLEPELRVCSVLDNGPRAGRGLFRR